MPKTVAVTKARLNTSILLLRLAAVIQIPCSQYMLLSKVEDTIGQWSDMML